MQWVSDLTKQADEIISSSQDIEDFNFSNMNGQYDFDRMIAEQQKLIDNIFSSIPDYT